MIDKKRPPPVWKGALVSLYGWDPGKEALFHTEAVLFLEDHLELHAADDLMTHIHVINPGIDAG